MAIAGTSYECLYADVGTNGRVNDDGVWNKCGLSCQILHAYPGEFREPLLS